MKLGSENKQKTMIAAVLGAVAVLFVLYELFSGGSTPNTVAPPAPAPVVKTTSVVDTHATGTIGNGKAAQAVAFTNTALDPSLKPDAMLEAESITYSGSGRNIFSMQSAPPPIPVAVAPARPKGPVAPVMPSGPPPPPPPPPIDLKFFGTAMRRDGSKRAFLLHGEEVFYAAPGEIVDRKYKVGAIEANGITITDMTNNNTQRLPLSQ